MGDTNTQDANNQTQQNSSAATTPDTQQQNTSPAAGGTQSPDPAPKTFTQEEVNAIGTKEKNQGKQSVLKLFNCANESEAKLKAEEFKKWQESQMTDEQKKSEQEAALKNAAAESEARAIAAENKLTVLSAGVTPESVDDALAIALLKVSEDKPLDKVLAEMKKESKYAGFFAGGESSTGTGSTANHTKGGNGGQDNIGARLAQRRATPTTKSNFFSD